MLFSKYRAVWNFPNESLFFVMNTGVFNKIQIIFWSDTPRIIILYAGQILVFSCFSMFSVKIISSDHFSMSEIEKRKYRDLGGSPTELDFYLDTLSKSLALRVYSLFSLFQCDLSTKPWMNSVMKLIFDMPNKTSPISVQLALIHFHLS